MMKKFFKWLFIFIFVSLALTLTGLGLYISSIYVNAKSMAINEDILTSSTLALNIYNNENMPIKEENEINHSYASIESLQPYTKEAFVSIEDKTFYNHHGVNYKRIAKAGLNNIKSRSLKEGASTITQQLIKNTQLSSEKTYKRKIKEIALAQKIENMYDKDKLLEFYLNVIYFGNNCYGIESASNYYFSKSANDLTLEESCTLAGMIKSPVKYSPIKHQENCLNRRNLVLKEMKKDGKISVETYNNSKNKKLELNLNNDKINKLNSYSQAAIDEAENILGMPARQIALSGYKIFTYQDEVKQEALANALKKQDVSCDSAGIVIENDKCAISAYIGDSSYKILEAKRQPGSCIKPVLVYAPALNEDIIYPCTQLLDEKVTIADYTPKNVGNIYRGYVSAREALSKSINIPAVKVLSYVGIDKAKAYAEEMGIKFNEKDDSYTIALGGMTYGVNIAQLAGAYTTFACDGYYKSPKFISFITDKNNKLVYINKTNKNRVLREDSAYLTTDMLKTCAKSGTARRLASLNAEIASKTGTVGRPNSKDNLDAWNISYTKAQTVGVWLGNLDNKPINYAGGNQPTEIVKAYFETIEDNSHFERPNSIVEKKVDGINLDENHKVALANALTPDRYTQTELFSTFNLPSDISNKFAKVEKTKLSSRVENGSAIIDFDAKDYETYNIIINGKIVQKITGKMGNQTLTIPLATSKEDVIFENFYTLSPDIKESQTLCFIKKEKKPTNDKWFI